ncbi:hypothetical protein DFH06DRAFT_1131938 [Mycena polygramma]|nr:hypothetical protein DFH06DRAFT_1131938 [Mycena polygramma]
MAEAYFQRDKFSQMLLGTGPSIEAESSDDDSDSAASDTDDSTDDDSRKKRRKKLRAKKAKRRHRSRDLPSSSRTTTGKSRDTDPKATEVEGMIKQLNSMSLEDPAYPTTYFKVMSLDTSGIAKQCVRPPAIPRPPGRGPQYRAPYSTSVPAVQPPYAAQAPQTYQTNLPPLAPQPPAATFPNNIPVANTGTPPNGGYPNRGEPGCYGCNDQGHRIGNCPRLVELINRGLIQQDPNTRRYVMKDGAPIMRWRGETLASAAERMTANQTNPTPVVRSHFVTLGGQVRAFYADQVEPNDNETDVETDEEDFGDQNSLDENDADTENSGDENDADTENSGDEYAVYSVPMLDSEDENPRPLTKALPVTRSEKRSQEARQGGTRVSPKTRSQMKEQSKARAEKESSPFKIIGRRGDGKIQAAPPMVVDAPEALRPQLPQPQIEPDDTSLKNMPPQRPVAARKPRRMQWDSQTDAVSKDKHPVPQPKPVPVQGNHRDKSAESISRPEVPETLRNKPAGRHSELSLQVERGVVVDKVFDTQITLSLRDLLANSKELSSGVQDLLKPHSLPEIVDS